MDEQSQIVRKKSKPKLPPAKRVTDIKKLLGGWPKEELNDGFENDWKRLRNANKIAKRCGEL